MGNKVNVFFRFIVLFIFTFFGKLQAQTLSSSATLIQNLNGSWNFRCLPKKPIHSNRDTKISNPENSPSSRKPTFLREDPMPAKVPGSVYLDLFANKIISDPFYQNNEQKNSWVENEDWEYSTTFLVDKKNAKEAIYKHKPRGS